MEQEDGGAQRLSPSVSLTPEQVEALDVLIEHLIAFRDLIDGDTDMEVDDDPTEDDHDAEDEGQDAWRARVEYVRQRRRRARL
jgi:hypothetical protein